MKTDNAEGWKEGWSEQYGQRYYYNEALGCTQWQQPVPEVPPERSSRDATAEASIAAALGFVDPIVHAVAVKILEDGCDHATAIDRLRKHCSGVDAVTCASAILERACAPHDGESDSSDAEPAAGCGESFTLAPWERASAPTSEELHALSVGELKRRMAAAGLDASCCVEKAELVAALTQDGGGPSSKIEGSCLSCAADGGGPSVLHEQIVAFAEWVRPQQPELRARSAIKRLIARVLQPLGAGTRLEPYGSSTYTGGAGGREKLALFCSDLDLAVVPPHSLKQVATLLSDARDVGGGRAFIDIDVLPARVPIVCGQHLRSGIEVDISGDHGGGDGGDVQALMHDALARYPQLAALAAVLKSLLMQRGLHEPHTGGLGSTKLYVLLVAWLEKAPRPSDLGQCLLDFLHAHARKMPAFAAAGDVEADLSAVRVPDCQREFRDAAVALEAASGQLRAILDVRALVHARQRSLRKAEGYTSALLAATAAAAGAGGTAGTSSTSSTAGAAARVLHLQRARDTTAGLSGDAKRRRR